jgi:hypothetical protein
MTALPTVIEFLFFGTLKQYTVGVVIFDSTLL